MARGNPGRAKGRESQSLLESQSDDDQESNSYRDICLNCFCWVFILGCVVGFWILLIRGIGGYMLNETAFYRAEERYLKHKQINVNNDMADQSEKRMCGSGYVRQKVYEKTQTVTDNERKILKSACVPCGKDYYAVGGSNEMDKAKRCKQCPAGFSTGNLLTAGQLSDCIDQVSGAQAIHVLATNNTGA